MIKLLSHTQQTTNCRPSKAIGTIRPNDTLFPWLPERLGCSEFIAANWFNRHTTHGTKWKAKQSLEPLSELCQRRHKPLTRSKRPSPWSKASKATIRRVNLKSSVHMQCVREQCFYTDGETLMKRPIPCLGFLETWHYKRVTERPLNPCQVCVCVFVFVCYLLAMVEDG